MPADRPSVLVVADAASVERYAAWLNDGYRVTAAPDESAALAALELALSCV